MPFWRNRHAVRAEELGAFVDGELDDIESRRVERHVESCAPCSEAVAELRAVSRAVSELPDVPAPRSFALRQTDVLPAPASGGMGLFGSLQPLLSGVAAIAIITFVVLAGVDISSDSSQDDNSSAAVLADDIESQQLSEAERRGVADGDVAPEAGDEYAPPQDADAFGSGGTPQDDSESSAGEYAEEPVAPEPGVSPGEITEDPQARVPAPGDRETTSAAPLADDDGDGTGLRVAEGAAAAVAIVAGGSVLLIWWRRRSNVV